MSDTAEITPKCVLNSGAPLSELMQQGELLNQNCPSREILRHLTSRWGVLVLIALLEKDQRFSELRRTVGGVSEKMLAQTLQTLEADGFVNRYSHPGGATACRLQPVPDRPGGCRESARIR